MTADAANASHGPSVRRLRLTRSQATHRGSIADAAGLKGALATGDAKPCPQASYDPWGLPAAFYEAMERLCSASSV
jgi:hypothetical protein